MSLLKTRLHELRKERNMQQSELAKVFDTTVEDIFTFEDDDE